MRREFSAGGVLVRRLRGRWMVAAIQRARAELERLSQANDAEKALDVLAELSELSKAIEEELQNAKRVAETEKLAKTSDPNGLVKP